MTGDPVSGLFVPGAAGVGGVPPVRDDHQRVGDAGRRDGRRACPRGRGRRSDTAARVHAGDAGRCARAAAAGRVRLVAGVEQDAFGAGRGTDAGETGAACDREAIAAAVHDCGRRRRTRGRRVVHVAARDGGTGGDSDVTVLDPLADAGGLPGVQDAIRIQAEANIQLVVSTMSMQFAQMGTVSSMTPRELGKLEPSTPLRRR